MGRVSKNMVGALQGYKVGLKGYRSVSRNTGGSQGTRWAWWGGSPGVPHPFSGGLFRPACSFSIFWCSSYAVSRLGVGGDKGDTQSSAGTPPPHLPPVPPSTLGGLQDPPPTSPVDVGTKVLEELEAPLGEEQLGFVGEGAAQCPLQAAQRRPRSAARRPPAPAPAGWRGGGGWPATTPPETKDPRGANREV